MAGYNGRKLSWNAAAAYADGKMPASKWTKTAILEGIEDYLTASGNAGYFHQFEKMTTSQLRCFIGSTGEWHHTSKYFNRTVFYALDEWAVDREFDGEPREWTVQRDGGFYSATLAEDGRYLTKNKSEARLMSDYDANQLVAINAGLGKMTIKERAI